MNWQAVIGLEVHVQLNTSSKIFSGAATSFGAPANTQACGVDLGLPGSLPVLNQQAVCMALKFGLAIGASIAKSTTFYRKNYFYPDLPKGYQISQLDRPIVGEGSLLLADGSGRRLDIERAHLEEDAGKSLHQDIADMTGIDLNRAGIPLLEIVTAPQIHQAKAAVFWLKKIHGLVYYLGICSGVMAEGALRCDANVSVRPKGQSALGERIEIKNLNSFRFVEQALDFEIDRQIRSLEQGGKIVRETRLYDSNQHKTRPMRSKEYMEDYRYFPEPDLLPLIIEDALIESVRQSLPELPDVRSIRYQKQYNLPEQTADYLCRDCSTADYFDETLRQCGDATAAANWIMGDLAAANRKRSITMAEPAVSSSNLARLITTINEATLSSKMAKAVFQALSDKQIDDVDAAVDKPGLQQLSDTDELQRLVAEVIAGHPKQVAQYHAGKTKLLGFFVGQIMQATQGRANPKQLDELLRHRLTKAQPE